MQIKEFLDQLRKKRNIAEAFFDLAGKFPERPAYSQAVINSGDKHAAIVETYASVANKVAKLAHFLRSLGVAKGARVAIISNTRPEWLIADFAIQAAAGISTSIYQSVNRDETGYILHDSGVDIVFAENQEQVDKLQSLLSSPCEIPATEDRPGSTVNISLKKIIVFEDVRSDRLIVKLDDILNDPNLQNTPPQTLSEQGHGDLASLVYTSGTTGPPKGVMQTHGNHLSNIWQSGRCGIFAPEGDMFLFLPLAHSFARLIGYIGFLTPTELRFPAVVDRKSSVLNAGSVLRDMRSAGANVVPTVPRILEKMVSAVMQKATGGGASAKLLAATLKLANRRYAAVRQQQRVRFATELGYRLTRPLRKKIKRALFGDHFMHVVSGGAKLPLQVAEFFAALEIDVYQGYGLTETVVATNVNPVGKNRIGSVGPCLEEVECKILDDGEILFRGPNIAAGYWNRASATKAAWDEAGWFHTGDIGQLDRDGYLFITGRKKELIVTAGGKKIAPGPIEERLVASPYISQAIVVGEGRPYCCVLIAPEVPALQAWAGARNQKLDLDHADTQALFESEIKAVNQHLSKFESIKRFRLVTDEFTVENGLLTPTFKIKRKLVLDRYSELIEQMYSAGGSGES